MMQATWKQVETNEWVGVLQLSMGDKRVEVAALVTVRNPFGDGDMDPAAEVVLFPRRKRDAAAIALDREQWEGAYPLPARAFVCAPIASMVPLGADPPSCTACGGSGRYVCLPGDITAPCPSCHGGGVDLAAMGRVVAEGIAGIVER